MRDRLARFMSGRYGVDSLGRAVMIAGMIFLVLNIFFPKMPFYLLALICLVYAYFRMLSRNISRRYQENQWFESRFGGIKRWFAKQKGYMSLRKNYRIFVCPSCHQKVKVPKGKGKISIHCPKCHTDFIKRS
ncbi:MAG: hypothetical protein MRZ59_01920 [Clostridiales bacterium]|nr:hypothetical protein [Clostridiales bacterium]MDY3745517.1 hypothetical protein [Lachnospiraceae bacterium]